MFNAVEVAGVEADGAKAAADPMVRKVAKIESFILNLQIYSYNACAFP